jgi:hypothetical protein
LNLMGAYGNLRRLEVLRPARLRQNRTVSLP